MYVPSSSDSNLDGRGRSEGRLKVSGHVEFSCRAQSTREKVSLPWRKCFRDRYRQQTPAESERDEKEGREGGQLELGRKRKRPGKEGRVGESNAPFLIEEEKRKGGVSVCGSAGASDEKNERKRRRGGGGRRRRLGEREEESSTRFEKMNESSPWKRV